MRQITIVSVLIGLCLAISGCTTLRESRGYLNEDVGNLIHDIKNALSLKKADDWVREHLW